MGGRPLCHPDAEAPFHVRRRGLEPLSRQRQHQDKRPALLRLPLEAGGLVDSPPYLQGFIKRHAQKNEAWRTAVPRVNLDPPILQRPESHSLSSLSFFPYLTLFFLPTW